MASQSEYAAHRGVSRKTVTVWKQRGLLVLNADGSVNAAKTDAFIANHGGNITPLPSRANVLPRVPADVPKVTTKCPHCGHPTLPSR